MLEAALSYAAHGWRVFPVEPRGKKPLIKDWPKKATTDARKINEWWTKWPDANIGVATGEGSGLFVLDVDGEEGSNSLIALEAEIGPLPETLESQTGTGGRHLFFLMPKRDIRNKQSFRPGLDIRGNGGYVLVAPSVHPNGRSYNWPYGDSDPAVKAPEAFLDVICPLQEPVTPPENKPVKPPTYVQVTPITERASLYLQECEPATQGQGGHDKLLWAARALVVGFELSPSAAKSLLWLDFNPRCSPPWDQTKSSDVKDFERKVDEALRTPGQKPRGWLLDECGLRSDDDALLELGKKLREGLMGQPPIVETPAPPPPKPKSVPLPKTLAKKIQVMPAVPIDIDNPTFNPFPMDCFPPKIAAYGYQAAEAHCVDLSFVGLPMLVVTSAAMGNVWRLRLKQGFDVPPTLWGGIVAASGTNKSGPLRAITEPLRATPPIEELGDNPMLNPQGRMIVSDATLEAIVNRLNSSPRGLCTYRSELAGWVKSFNAYKKGGGDEQAWIEFWDAHEYQLDRKTNQEEAFIPAAAVSVIGGIQPKVLVECFDPGKFASGLVARLLITRAPDKGMKWTEIEIDQGEQNIWSEAIMWLRTRPFAAIDTANGRYVPHILTLSPTAHDRYVAFFDEISNLIRGMDEMSRTFASKSRVIAARLALCHHGLIHSAAKSNMMVPVSMQSIEAGATLARWFLNEQVRVYGLASSTHTKLEQAELVAKIRQLGGSVTVRTLMRVNSRKFPDTQGTKLSLDALVAAGLGQWDVARLTFTVKEK